MKDVKDESSDARAGVAPAADLGEDGRARGRGGAAPASTRGLLIAVFAFLTVFAASAVPVPLYAEYQATVGLTDADISATMLLYLFGVVGTLFLAGSFSDALGRRPLTMLSILLAIAGCVLFLRASSPLALLVARFVQGVSCGLAMSAVSALIVDSAVGRYEIVGVTIAGCGSLLGIMAGSLATGFLCMATSDHALVYYGVIACLVLALVLIPLVPETVVRRAPLRTACKPVVSVEPHMRRVFPIAACAYVSTWGVGTYYQSFSSPVAVSCFGSDDVLLASVILALAMAPSALGGPMEARLRSGFSLRLGMVLFLASVAVMCAAMQTGMLAVFLASVALFSLSMGICLSGSLRLLFAEARGSSTAVTVSTINLVAYVGAAALSFLMGVLVERMSLIGVLAVLGLVGLAGAVLVFARTREKRS